MLRSRFVLVGVLALLALAAAPAGARDGDDAARADGTCTAGATSTLRLRSRDGTIRVEFEVRRRVAHERWRVYIVHERRVAYRGTYRTYRSRGGFRVRRRVTELAGPNRVTARGSGPRGLRCEATATLIA